MKKYNWTQKARKSMKHDYSSWNNMFQNLELLFLV